MEGLSTKMSKKRTKSHRGSRTPTELIVTLTVGAGTDSTLLPYLSLCDGEMSTQPMPLTPIISGDSSTRGETYDCRVSQSRVCICDRSHF